MTTLLARIGLITAGGDCPGLNAVIRAVTKSAIDLGIEVLGIEDGFLGMIEDRVRPLLFNDVSNILTVGGTVLGSSNKANPMRYAASKDSGGKPIFEHRADHCLGVLARHGIDTIVLAGGDGSMSIAAELIDHAALRGQPLRFIGVPKTIDNDLFGTDITFGFQTAVSIATEALDRVHTTAASHHRAMVVEVMGRNAGWIALHAGVASGADVILIPEIDFNFDSVCRVVVERSTHGKRCSIICVAEGAKPRGGAAVVARTDLTSPDPVRYGGVGKLVADTIEARTGIESRYVALGHVQRGGMPVAADRVLATQLGHHAMTLLRAGRFNRMVAVRDGQLTDVEIRLCAGKQRTVGPDDPLIAAACGVGVVFGE